MIIGAQKCGTTSLHHYLAQHPDTSMSEPKELNFFLERRNWGKGVDWYRSHFDADKPVRGESSPNYTAAPSFGGVPARMAATIPDARLIYVVRDPIKRIRSQWIHNYARRNTNRWLDDAATEANVYVNRSKYFMQISAFLEHFPMERILVVDQAELLNERRHVLQEVFGFLGLDADFWHPEFEKERLTGSNRRRLSLLGYVLGVSRDRGKWVPRRIRRSRLMRRPFDKPDFSAETRAQLVARLQDDVAAFRELTGKPFSHWSI